MMMLAMPMARCCCRVIESSVLNRKTVEPLGVLARPNGRRTARAVAARGDEGLDIAGLVEQVHRALVGECLVSVIAQRHRGKRSPGDPVDVSDHSDVEQRLGLAGRVSVACAQGDVQVVAHPPRRDRDRDVLDVVGGDSRERTGSADRQSPQQALARAASDPDR